MIIFIITDLQGMDSVKQKTLKKLSAIHDVLVINVSDAYLFGENGFDLESNSYIPSIISDDEELYTLEKSLKQEILAKAENKFRKNKISVTSINSCSEISSKIIELLERHKYANTN